MNVKMTIEAIRNLTHSFNDQHDIEKLKTYTTIKTLLDEIKNHAKQEEENGNRIPNVNIYIAELMTPLQCLARIEDYRHHDDSQNIVWVITGLDKLLSVHCFNLCP